MGNKATPPWPEPNALRRYELLSEHTRDIVLFLRPDGQILEANKAAVQSYGYARWELLTMRIEDLRAEETLDQVEQQMARARAGGILFETLHRRKDGSLFPVEVSSSPSHIGGILLSVIRDITNRKRSETTRVLLHEIDQRILRREPLSQIVQSLCDGLATLFGYTLVWVAMKREDGQVGILANAGIARGFLDGLEIRWADGPLSLGPTGTAIRTGQVQLIPVTDEGWNAFRERAEQFGLQSGLSLPLIAQGQTLGALSFYSTRAETFTEAIVAEMAAFASRVAVSLLAVGDQEQMLLRTAALEAAANAVVITNRDGCILWANRAWTDLTGYSVAETLGQTPRILKSGSQSNIFYRHMWETILSGHAWRGELYNRRKDGSLYVEEMTITPVRTATGEVSHFIAVKQDVSERKRQEEQLRHLAMHDPVTDLANRRALEETLERAVNRYGRSGQGALLLMDLDNFKQVNDVRGHAVGDQLLVAIAHRLRDSVRPFDHLARWGGDEFAVLLEDVTMEEAAAVAYRLRQSVAQAKQMLVDYDYPLGISIGIAPIGYGIDAETVMLLADRGLYAAKDAGGNRAEICRPGSDLATRPFETGRWVPRLREAMAREEFLLHFQPVVRLATGQVDHYEALLRLRAADGSLVLPGSFLPSAQRAGMMPALDLWVVRAALAELKARPQLGLAVNLSGPNVGNAAAVEAIARELAAEPEAARRICFEIAEGAAVQDLVATREAITRLRELGPRFTLDNFGTGFTSFSYLRSLPVDGIKMAGPFMRRLDSDPVDRAVVQGITNLAHTLGCQVFAKWVDTEQTAAALQELGVTFAQGLRWGEASADLI